MNTSGIKSILFGGQLMLAGWMMIEHSYTFFYVGVALIIAGLVVGYLGYRTQE